MDYRTLILEGEPYYLVGVNIGGKGFSANGEIRSVDEVYKLALASIEHGLKPIIHRGVEYDRTEAGWHYEEAKAHMPGESKFREISMRELEQRVKEDTVPPIVFDVYVPNVSPRAVDIGD
tara:strand:- start:440 stop:799 length:360 start_codon:yes stop_codon:yes gene_type:complete